MDPAKISNQVKVIEVSMVSPPDSDSLQLPLTFFDMLWLRFPPNQRVFFYSCPQSNSRSSFLDNTLPRLKHSLSLTLQLYLPLAGNLTWFPSISMDKPAIHYNQLAGKHAVSLTVAESAVDFLRLSGDGFNEALIFHPFVPPLLPVSETSMPVMALQVTLFPDAGFSIGYTAHHAVLDGKSTAMFMKSWASVCLQLGAGVEVEVEPPFYDRSSFYSAGISATNLEEIYLKDWKMGSGGMSNTLKTWELTTPNDVIKGTFILREADLAMMKKNLGHINNISDFTMAAAYTWVCAVRADHCDITEEEEKGVQVQLAINVDCRRLMELPFNYFGNCVGFCFAMANVNDLKGGRGIGVAVERIGAAIEDFKNGGMVRDAEKWVGDLLSIEKVKIYSIAGSPRFGLYELDFGWGRPRKIELISNDKSGAFCFTDNGREGGGGIEIGLAMKKRQLEGFASFFAGGLK